MSETEIALAERVAYVAARSAPLTTLEKLRYTTIIAIAWLSDPSGIPEDTTSPLPDDLAIFLEPQPADFWCWNLFLEFVDPEDGIQVVAEDEELGFYFYRLAELGIIYRHEIVPHLKSDDWDERMRVLAEIYDSLIQRS
jgi:hypothetical protein